MTRIAKISIFCVFFIIVNTQNIPANDEFALVILKSEGELCNSIGSNKILRDWFEEVVIEYIESIKFKSIQLKILKLSDLVVGDKLLNIYKDIVTGTLINNDEEFSKINELTKENINRGKVYNDYPILFKLEIFKEYNIRFLQGIDIICLAGVNYLRLNTVDVKNNLLFRVEYKLPSELEINEENLKKIFWKLFIGTFERSTSIKVDIPKFLWDDKLDNKYISFNGDLKTIVSGENSKVYQRKYRWSIYKVDYKAKRIKSNDNAVSYHLPENLAIRLLMGEIVDKIKLQHSKLNNHNPDSSVAVFENDLCSIKATIIKNENKRKLEMSNLGLTGSNYYYIVGTIYDAFWNRQITAGNLIFIGRLRKYNSSIEAKYEARGGNTNYGNFDFTCYRQRNLFWSNKPFGIRVSYSYHYSHSLVFSIGPIIGLTRQRYAIFEPHFGIGLSYDNQKFYPVLSFELPLKYSFFALVLRKQLALNDSGFSYYSFGVGVQLATALFQGEKKNQTVILTSDDFGF